VDHNGYLCGYVICYAILIASRPSRESAKGSHSRNRERS